jgi:hypothetical protein
MKWKFACPGCRAVLNPNRRVVFRIEFGGERGLMLLSAELGDYLSICDQDFSAPIEKGNLVKFSCPVCDLELSAPDNPRFAEILQLRPDQAPRRVRFSQVYGEHATFSVDGDQIESYGEHAALFDNLNFSETDRWW